jgi:hypothetical protein
MRTTGMVSQSRAAWLAEMHSDQDSLWRVAAMLRDPKHAGWVGQDAPEVVQLPKDVADRLALRLEDVAANLEGE